MDFLELFPKVKCNEEFLHTHFDNFMILYGIVYDFRNCVSSIDVSATGDVIDYIIHFKNPEDIDLNATWVYDNAVTTLYGNQYRSVVIIDNVRKKCIINLTKIEAA